MQTTVAVAVIAALVFIVVFKSIHRIGPAQVGLVNKRVSFKKLKDDNPIAFHGEAGYQADLLMPGLRFRLWPIYGVQRFPWVQVPAGETGVVIAQVGGPLPIGAKSARYLPAFGNFSDVRTFIDQGGEKGVQRPVLPPGTLVAIHPVAFLIITSREVYGLPVSPDLVAMDRGGQLTAASFGLSPEQLRVVVIAPQGSADVVGLVTTLEGTPPEKGDIASRLGGFADVEALEAADPQVEDAQLIETLLGSKNQLHNSYQDFQAFLERPDPPGQSGVDTLVLISASSKDYEFKRLLDLLGRLIAQRAGERDPAASFSIRKEVRPEIGAVYRVVHRGRPKTLVLLANGFVVNFFARYEKGVKTEYIDPIVSLQMLGLVRLLRHDVPPGLHPISEYLERADIARYWQGIEAACRPLAISG